MDWVESKSVRGLCPEFAEVFVGNETLEGLESSGEVVGPEEVVQVRFESARSTSSTTTNLHTGDVPREGVPQGRGYPKEGAPL